MGPCGQTAALRSLNFTGNKRCGGLEPATDWPPLRSARVTSCTGDTGRNAMYYAALGLIFRVFQGLSVIDWR